MASEQDEPIDISKVHADEELIEKVRRGEDVGDDPLAEVLKALRAEGEK
jgi:hypothetical protein